MTPSTISTAPAGETSGTRRPSSDSRHLQASRDPRAAVLRDCRFVGDADGATEAPSVPRGPPLATLGVAGGIAPAGLPQEARGPARLVASAVVEAGARSRRPRRT